MPQGVGAQPTAMLALRDAYLSWVEATEVQLQSISLDPAVVSALHTPRYWRIRSLGEDPRPFPLVDAEISQQVAGLQSLLDDLTDRISRLASAPGHLIVLDTNILLEFLPPDQVNWPDVVGVKPVRLVVPLRVIEELDAKKYARREDLASRARRILPRLESAIGRGGVPGQLAADVTLEVLVDPGPRYRPMDADEEIIDICRELRQLSGQTVTLVTGDTAMRLRADAQAIPVLAMPASYGR